MFKSKNISKKFVCAPEPKLFEELKKSDDEKILCNITEKNINKMEVEDNINEINDNIDYNKKEKVLQVADFPKISQTNSDVC